MPYKDPETRRAYFKRIDALPHRKNARNLRRYEVMPQTLKRFQELREAVRLEWATRPRPQACEICDGKTKQLHCDHDHKTGKFRGWICGNCNRALGLVKDNPKTLERMVTYLAVPQIGPVATTRQASYLHLRPHPQ
jgi:hypothetical protein